MRGGAPDAGGAPPWLFSFVDLAFLLIIAMTQLAGTDGPELGEIVVPRIHAEATSELPSMAKARWQLRVHAPSADDPSAFQLVNGEDATLQLALPELRAKLAALEQEGAERPLLAPHETSMSRDLLDAVALLEEFWPSRRRATIERLADLR